MKHIGMMTALVAGVALAATAGCVRTAEDLRGERVLETRAPNSYLTCARTGVTARPDTQLVGPAGARLRVGNNEITIPANAIPEQRRIVFGLARADTAGVEVDAGGPLDFQGNRSAPITIDLSHCGGREVEGEWWVWRINRRNINESQKLLSTVAGGRAIVHVDSLSSYMIAN